MARSPGREAPAKKPEMHSDSPGRSLDTRAVTPAVGGHAPTALSALEERIARLLSEAVVAELRGLDVDRRGPLPSAHAPD